MRSNPTDDKISPARKCAQIKHILRLAQCVHPEKSSVFLMSLNAGWIEYCTDCDKVTDKDSNYL